MSETAGRQASVEDHPSRSSGGGDAATDRLTPHTCARDRPMLKHRVDNPEIHPDAVLECG